MLDEVGKWLGATVLALLCVGFLALVGVIVWNVASRFPLVLAGVPLFVVLTAHIRNKVWP